MAEYKAGITVNIGADISNLQSQLGKVKNLLNNSLHLDKGSSNSVNKLFDNLEKNIEKYKELTSKPLNSDAEVKSATKLYSTITSDVEKLQYQLKNIKGIDPEKLFPKAAEDRLNDLNKSLEDFANFKLDKQAQRNQLVQQIEEAQAALKELEAKQKDLAGKKGLHTALADNLREAYEEAKAAYDKAAADLANAKKNIPASEKATLTKARSAAKKKFDKAEEEWTEYQKNYKPNQGRWLQVTNQIEKAAEALQQLQNQLKEFDNAVESETPEQLEKMRQSLANYKNVDIEEIPKTFEEVKAEIEAINTARLEQVKQTLQDLGYSSADIDNVVRALDQANTGLQEDAKSASDFSKQMDGLTKRFIAFFEISNGWNLLRRGIREAIKVVQDLDKAMTDIAVVSKYSLDEVWAMRNAFVDSANSIGASTQDMVEATTLYVQQGLSLAEAQQVANETMKMGRIANLDGKDATDLMTAAIRGYRMELTDANHVNDVYSNLAAKSASNTRELATAMSKTASTAYTSGASFENMSAFLAQIIETTREAPETAGTAMKTIISRFQELKNAVNGEVEVEGEIVDVNKVEKALRTAGVALRDAKGEFRGFDDVILELSSKWDSLNVMTQRYIATIAAGSRQQSRFLALLNDNKRLTELVGYANDSAGASAEQFNKTLDSLEASMNKLKNAWDLFLTGFVDNKIIKAFVDLGTLLLNLFNNLLAPLNSANSAFLNIMGSLAQVGILMAAFIAAHGILQKALDKTSQSLARYIKMNDAAGESSGNAAKKVLLESLVMGNKGEGAGGKLSIKDRLGRYGKELPQLFKSIKAGFSGSKEAIESVTAAGAQLEGTAAGAGQAITKVGLAIGHAIPTVLAIGAAIATVVVIIKAIDEAIYTTKEKIADTTEAIRVSKETLNGLQEESKKVQTSLDTLKEKEDSFEILIKGSEQWYTTLHDINGEILALIDALPQLAQYVTMSSNGVMSITAEGQAEIKKYQDFLAAREESVSKSVLRGQRNLDVLNAQQTFEDSLDQLTEDFNEQFNLKGMFKWSKKELVKNITETNFEGWDNLGRDALEVYAEKYDELLYERAASINSANMKLGASYSEDAVDQVIYAALEEKVAGYSEQIIEAGSQKLGGFTSMFSGKAINQIEEWMREEGMDNVFRLNDASLGTLRELYEKIFDYPADLEMTAEEIYNIISAYKIDKKIEDLHKEYDIINKEQKEVIQKALLLRDGLANTVKEDEIDDLDKILAEIPDNVKQLFNLTETSFSSLVEDYNKAIKRRRSRLKENIFALDQTYDAVYVSLREMVDNLSEKALADAEKIFSNTESPFSWEGREAIKTNLAELSLPEQENLLAEFSKIDLSKPIDAFEQLNNLAVEGGNGVKQTAVDLLKTEESVLSYDAQFQYLLMTEEDLNKEMDEFIAKNDELSADNVDDLRKQYKSLDKLMKNTKLNATSMAKALQMLKSGNIKEINGVLVEQLKYWKSLEANAQQVLSDIANFDPGIDTGQGVDFVTQHTKTLLDLITNGEWGNPQIDAFLDEMFGPSFLDQATTAEDKVRLITQGYEALAQVTEENGMRQWWQALAEDTTILGENITEDKKKYDWFVEDLGDKGIKLNIDNFRGTFEDLVKELAELEKIPEATARKMLMDWQNKSPDFKMDMDARDEAKRYGLTFGSGTLATYEPGEHGNKQGKVTFLDTQIRVAAEMEGMSTKEYIKEMEKRYPDFDVDVIPTLNEETGVFDPSQTLQTLQDKGLFNLNDYVEGNTLDLDSMQVKFESFDFNEDEVNQLLIQALNDVDLSGEEATANFQGLPLPLDKLRLEGGHLNLDSFADDFRTQIANENLGKAIAEAMGTVEIKGEVTDANIKVMRDRIEAGLQGMQGTVKVSISNNVEDDPALSNLSANLNLKPAIDGKTNIVVRIENASKGLNNGSPSHVPQDIDLIPTEARGTNNFKGGLALVGEGDGPELIQSDGYSYIAGLHGPEVVDLNKNDIVYSNAQTKQIFKRGGTHIPGFKEGYMPNFEETKGTGESIAYIPGYNPTPADEATTDNTNAVEGNTEATKENTEKWENSIDFLTRQVSRLETYTNKRELLEKERDNLIERGNVGWRDLVRFQNEIVDTLKLEIAQRKENLDRSRKELQDIRVKAGDDTFNGQSIRQFVDYIEGQGLLYNKEMVDAFIEKYKGTEQEEEAKAFYDRIQEYINKFEDVSGKINDNLEGIRNDEAELIKAQQEFKDAAVEMESRIIDALVSDRQRQIDELSNNYEAINTANDELVNTLQQGINDIRAQREQDKAAADLQKTERQLALMSMDTSGANRLDILKTQESLDDQRQSYTDSLIDKSIEQMTRDNEKAAQQREQQIALMEAQLQYDIDNGIIASQADELLHAMERNSQSMIEKVERLIKLNEDYNSKGILNRQDFVTELGNQKSEAQAYLNREPGASNAVTNFTRANGMKDNTRYETQASNTKLTTSLYTGAKNTTVDAVNAKLDPLLKKYSGKFKSEGGLNNDEEVIARGIYGSWWAGGSGWTAERVAEKFGDRIAARVMAIRQSFLDKKTDPKNWPMSVSDFHRFKYDQFETGGLADFTGPAWLDGTKSKPEYVLNADQTKRFFDLLDFTKDIGNDNNSTLIGDTYYNISMSNEIASDYDVDNMWDEMQRKIYENAAYRNVQSLNFGRR